MGLTANTVPAAAGPDAGDDDQPEAVAVALVRTRAPETVFANLIAAPVAGHQHYWQVNRVDRNGQILRGGWTFLVNVSKQIVVRTTGDPAALNFSSALKTGVQCWP
jgi:hypothetical protein